ncbi:hypothetical protein HOD96_02855 [Candidatus Falkowbacteria bacterium]|jgi:hypothetical protein|nr:hypothetical protein [Candidatus Falkowbacteria bacterium]
MHLKTKNLIKAIYFSVILIVILAVSFLMFFLYKKIYLTLRNVEVVYTSQSDSAILNINTKLFEEVKENIKKKNSGPLPDFNLIENPFE